MVFKLRRHSWRIKALPSLLWLYFFGLPAAADTTLPTASYWTELIFLMSGQTWISINPSKINESMIGAFLHSSDGTAPIYWKNGQSTEVQTGQDHLFCLVIYSAD